MKTLTLSIKRKYFDEILAGTKKTETREIRANNAHRYIQYVDDKTGKIYPKYSDCPEDAECSFEPIKYDALKLLTGAYNIAPRPYIVVEVKDAEVFLLQDEQTGEEITYEYNGETFIAAQIDYHLGKIIEDKSII